MTAAEQWRDEARQRLDEADAVLSREATRIGLGAPIEPGHEYPNINDEGYAQAEDAANLRRLEALTATEVTQLGDNDARQQFEQVRDWWVTLSRDLRETLL